MSAEERLLVFVRGHVQGVGFRWWTRSRALELGLVGHAANLPDGRVEVSAQGTRVACEQLLGLLAAGLSATAAGEPARPGRVDGVVHHWLSPVSSSGGFVER